MKAHELRPMLGNNRCQGQPPARKLVRYLREDQVRKKKGHQVLDRTKALYGPRTQAYGETKYKNFNYYKLWAEPRPCMVLGLKPMGKPSIKKKDENYKFWAEPRPCMVLGLKPMGKPITKFFYYYKLWTEPRRCTFLGPKPTGKPIARIRKGLNFARWAT